MLVECKRVADACWIFLQDSSPAAQSDRTKTFARTEKWFNWYDLQAEPVSVESQFCVVPGHDSHARPLLEKAAAELVLATEAIAFQERHERHMSKQHMGRRFYYAAIVTTAQLKVCAFDPGRMDPSKGNLGDDAVFDDVPFVRFRKELSSHISGTHLQDPSENVWMSAREHVVFVINTAALLRFLGSFNVRPHSWNRIMNISSGVTEQW